MFSIYVPVLYKLDDKPVVIVVCACVCLFLCLRVCAYDRISCKTKLVKGNEENEVIFENKIVVQQIKAFAHNHLDCALNLLGYFISDFTNRSLFQKFFCTSSVSLQNAK